MKIKKVDINPVGGEYWVLPEWEGGWVCIGKPHLYDVPPPQKGDEVVLEPPIPWHSIDKVWINGTLVRDNSKFLGKGGT